jgi:RNA polymerase sigma-32 factor
MNRRMLGGDHSLNAQMNRNDGEETEWQDLLTDERENLETLFAKHEEKTIKNKLMVDALNLLKTREKDIIIKRRLTDEPRTLEELSQEYKVSRERVRQIETRAFEKLQEAMKLKASELKLLGTE